MPTLEITSRQRSALRAAAHPLRPVVLIGDNGLTETVLKEIDRGLNAHELIKVRVAGDDREARVQIYDQICDALSCAPVHHLGKMLILFRPGKKQAYAEAMGEKSSSSSPPKRKASEPHTPKKLAAQGKTLVKPTRRVKAEPKIEGHASERFPTVISGERPPRPSTRPSKTTTAPTRTIRRTSALSLKAGARRGLGGGGAGARRSIKK